MKEAIEFLENIIQPTPAIKPRLITIEKVNNIISLLYQGEKYRLMWEEFCVNEGDLVKVVNCIKRRYEQKYFPKVE